MKQELNVKLILEEKEFTNEDGKQIKFIQKNLIIPIKNGNIYCNNIQMKREFKKQIQMAFDGDLFIKD